MQDEKTLRVAKVGDYIVTMQQLFITLNQQGLMQHIELAFV